MGFYEELNWRNMLHDSTPGCKEKLDEGMCVGYIGFDPTAPSMTIGNFVQIMILKFFQLAGHKPIVLMGGATGRIGDPSGKDKERELKTEEELDKNLAKQVEQIKKLLDFENGDNRAILVNNYDFYRDMSMLDFLRDVGKNTTVAYMLSKESVKRRLESGISYTEFSYQLLQAYDFYCMYKNHNCIFQMGGSDQWGNIIAGTDYIQKNIVNAKAFALTTPLLTKSDGKKFGKSEEGNIWLDAALTSPYKFYQFWLNADDADLQKLFRYFSLKSKEEILQLEEIHKEDPRQLKKILAEELTIRIHGEEAFKNVAHVSEILFSKDCTPESLKLMSGEVFQQLANEIPEYSIPRSQINATTNITTLLSELTTITASKSEARRAIQGNAITINKNKISDADYKIEEQAFLHQHYLLIENGKKNKYLIKLN